MQEEHISVRSKSRKYELDENFFNDISTINQAYWLGFCLADGSIPNNKNDPYKLRIGIQWNDIVHVKKFKHDIKYSGPIHRVKYLDKRYDIIRERADLTLCSKALVSDLIKKGWFDFKNYGNTSIINHVPNDLLLHLIRGMIDGDGSIGHYQRGHRSCPSLFFTDLHKSVVEWVAVYFNREFNIRIPKISKNGDKAYAIKYCSASDLNKLLPNIYISEPWLTRKQMKSREVLALSLPRELDI